MTISLLSAVPIDILFSQILPFLHVNDITSRMSHLSRSTSKDLADDRIWNIVRDRTNESNQSINQLILKTALSTINSNAPDEHTVLPMKVIRETTGWRTLDKPVYNYAVGEKVWVMDRGTNQFYKGKIINIVRPQFVAGSVGFDMEQDEYDDYGQFIIQVNRSDLNDLRLLEHQRIRDVKGIHIKPVRALEVKQQGKRGQKRSKFEMLTPAIARDNYRMEQFNKRSKARFDDIFDNVEWHSMDSSTSTSTSDTSDSSDSNNSVSITTSTTDGKREVIEID